MNNIIKALIVLLILLVAGFVAVQVSMKKDDVYEVAQTASVDDIFNQDGRNIYYFYQVDCAHCKALKPRIQEFNEAIESTDLNFYLVDMAKDENSGSWYEGEDYTKDENYKSNPSDIKSIDDLSIVGTPSILTVEDGKATNYGVGSSQILDILGIYDEEFDLGVNLEPVE